jgi:hypothetical protein
MGNDARRHRHQINQLEITLGEIWHIQKNY